ncbi:MAG: GUN4 domain-containing protein [Leptolyngbyaceae cyanobacterium SM2_3_12]|nr:GUN4 domain-containing protein [Leptolyngbyaceae cyanobacterium SM2_3_12]
MVELGRQFPLSEDTWEVLKELAENLSLPLDQATAIYQEHLHKIQAEATAIRQQAEVAAASSRQQQVEIQEHQDQIDRQQQLDQYRETFRQTILTQLYPLAYDQGRLEQARVLLEISPAEASHIEAAVRGELYGQIQSAIGIDYTRLRQLLWDRSWQEADQETENVLLKALGQNLQPLGREAIGQLPCTDLATIDQLWSRYSEGQFGFRAQQQIYHQVNQQPADFCRLLGWRGNPLSPSRGILPYKNLQFNLSAPPGHLPTWRWGCPSLDSGYEISDALVEGFFMHLAKCMPLETVVMPRLASPFEGG